jgi:hypothetical protein
MDDLIKDNESGIAKRFIEDESWLRQPGETGAAYNAFCLYRDFGGDRSIKKVLVASSIVLSRCGIWQAWSSKYLWVKRVSDYDKHLDNIKRNENETRLRERVKKHLEISEKMLEIVVKRLEKFDPDELSQGMMMEWLKNCVSIERGCFESEVDDKTKGFKQLEISFFEDFNGV